MKKSNSMKKKHSKSPAAEIAKTPSPISPVETLNVTPAPATQPSEQDVKPAAGPAVERQQS